MQIDEYEDRQICSAVHEGTRVYVLLDDDRILGSRPLETPYCAELHAAQVVKLRLRPTFLVRTLGYIPEAG